MTPAEWAEAARDAILEVAGSQTDWTADDVWDLLDAGGVQLPEGKDPRALGNVLGAMKREGLILKAGHSRESRRNVRNHGLVAVWTTPSMAWAVPDAVPVPRPVRAALDAEAARLGESVMDLVVRAVKAELGGRI